jgi:hypothetical protein
MDILVQHNRDIRAVKQDRQGGMRARVAVELGNKVAMLLATAVLAKAGMAATD